MIHWPGAGAAGREGEPCLIVRLPLRWRPFVRAGVSLSRQKRPFLAGRADVSSSPGARSQIGRKKGTPARAPSGRRLGPWVLQAPSDGCVGGKTGVPCFLRYPSQKGIGMASSITFPYCTVLEARITRLGSRRAKPSWQHNWGCVMPAFAPAISFTYEWRNVLERGCRRCGCLSTVRRLAYRCS